MSTPVCNLSNPSGSYLSTFYVQLNSCLKMTELELSLVNAKKKKHAHFHIKLIIILKHCVAGLERIRSCWAIECWPLMVFTCNDLTVWCTLQWAQFSNLTLSLTIMKRWSTSVDSKVSFPLCVWCWVFLVHFPLCVWCLVFLVHFPLCILCLVFLVHFPFPIMCMMFLLNM